MVSSASRAPLHAATLSNRHVPCRMNSCLPASGRQINCSSIAQLNDHLHMHSLNLRDHSSLSSMTPSLALTMALIVARSCQVRQPTKPHDGTPGRPGAAPLLCECLRTSSCPSASPTASRAAFGEMPRLRMGPGYLVAWVTLNASSSYTCLANSPSSVCVAAAWLP